MGEKINEALKADLIFEINLFGYKIPVTDIVIVTWAVMALLVIGSIVLTRKMRDVPGKGQNVAEMIVTFLNNQIKEIIGSKYKAVVPYVGTIFLFLVVSNIMGLFNFLPPGVMKIEPPTRNINVTLPLGIMSIFAVIFYGFKLNNRGYLREFVKPIWFMLPFHMLDYVIRPVTLCFRLLGNIFGALILMELIYATVPAFLPAVLGVYFDIFDGFLQAYIFTILTTIFISEAVE